MLWAYEYENIDLDIKSKNSFIKQEESNLLNVVEHMKIINDKKDKLGIFRYKDIIEEESIDENFTAVLIQLYSGTFEIRSTILNQNYKWADKEFDSKKIYLSEQMDRVIHDDILFHRLGIIQGQFIICENSLSKELAINIFNTIKINIDEYYVFI